MSDSAPPPPPPRNSLKWRIWKRFTAAHVAAYRLTGGRIGKRFRGAPVLLLDHVGRKSGRKHTTPLMYVEDGADVVIIASLGGAAKDPLWWPNLKANPETTVQVNSERRNVVAHLARPEERERLWQKAVDVYSEYARYQQITEREIPVIVLSPR